MRVNLNESVLDEVELLGNTNNFIVFAFLFIQFNNLQVFCVVVFNA